MEAEIVREAWSRGVDLLSVNCSRAKDLRGADGDLNESFAAPGFAGPGCSEFAIRSSRAERGTAARLCTSLAVTREVSRTLAGRGFAAGHTGAQGELVASDVLGFHRPEAPTGDQDHSLPLNAARASDAPEVLFP